MDAIISNTVYWVLGGLVLVGFLGLPLLRATAMLVTGVFAAVRMIDGWVKSRPLGAGPERPLSLQGLPPALADLTRQTRFLTLELRRHSELAPSWPQAPTDGKQSWWSALVGVGGFEPHTEAMREVWEWIQAYERLPAADRERLDSVGVDPGALRDLLGAELSAVDQVRQLTGVAESFDERFADLASAGYRGSGAQLPGPALSGSRRPLQVALPAAKDTAEGESQAAPEDDDAALRARRRLWVEVMQAHGRGISRIAGSHAKSQSEREDLEQDISLALWQALPSFRGESSVRTFVYRIARYCCYRILRSRSRLKLDEYSDEEIGDPSVCIESWMNHSDEIAQLERALERLPEGSRSTLALRLEGKSYAEIADILGITERNVSVRLVRARQKIAEQLRAA